MTFNKKIFSKFQEQNVGMQEESGDDVTYSMTEMGTISFRIPSNDVLHLHDALFVPKLMKSLLSISAITDKKCVSELFGNP
jgi:hypothetical protein